MFKNVMTKKRAIALCEVRGRKSNVRCLVLDALGWKSEDCSLMTGAKVCSFCISTVIMFIEFLVFIGVSLVSVYSMPEVGYSKSSVFLFLLLFFL